MVSITSIFVYPVKSCKGIALEQAFIAPTGLRYDRHWLISDPAGKMITQRQKPQLALVEVALTPSELLTGAAPTLEGAELTLRAPGMPELRVPLDRAGKQPSLVPVTVWDWSGEGADEGPAAAEWLTKYLGTPARLVRYAGQAGKGLPPPHDPTRRALDPAWSPGCFETAFADGFPFLLASQASLDALNQSLPQPIPIDRFRANILVGAGAGEEAPAPWDEDRWEEVQVGALAPASAAGGGVKFQLVKPCDRCRVPTIDQATGVRSPDNEPTETLQRLRSGGVLGWTSPPPFKHSVFFAWNLVTQDSGAVAVGDPVQVLSWRQGPPQPREA